MRNGIPILSGNRGVYNQADEGRPVGKIEYLSALGAVLVYEGAFMPLYRSGINTDPTAVAEGDPIARYAQLLILATLLVLTIIRWSKMKPLLRLGVPYVFIIAFCLTSTIWSQFPFITFRRSVSLFSCFLFGYYAYVTFGPRRFIRMLAVATTLTSITSLILYAAVPGLVLDISSFDGAVLGIRGVFAQKNELSVYTLLGICSYLYLGYMVKNPTRFERSCRYLVVFSLLALAASRGMTSMIALMCVIAAALRLRPGQSRRFVALMYYGAGSVALVLVCIMLFDTALLFDLIGKDPSLTGRMPLWAEAIDAIKDRPLFGAGYAAFWHPLSRETQYIWSRLAWNPPSAHNGFIQLALDLGLIGMTAYLYLLLRLVYLTVKAINFDELPEARWLALFLVAVIIENLDEGTLAWPDAMAMQVAFGTAMTESWWRAHRARVAVSRVGRASHAYAMRVIPRPAERPQHAVSAGE